MIGGLLPDITLRLTTAAMAGDRAETQQLDASLAPLGALARDQHDDGSISGGTLERPCPKVVLSAIALAATVIFWP